MDEFPKVLVGTPTYEGKDYCLERWVANIRNLDYANYRFCVVDNTAHKRYYNKLRRKYPSNVVHVQRGQNSREALANSSNYLRQKVLDEGYDYLLMVEVDLFPQADVIQRLMRHNKLVVGHPYFTGVKERRPCVFTTVEKEKGVFGTQWIDAKSWNKIANGGLHRVHGMGVGCVLIHRSVLKQIRFYYSRADDVLMAQQKSRRYPDTYFYLELHNRGIPVFLDTSKVVEHDHRGYAGLVDK